MNESELNEIDEIIENEEDLFQERQHRLKSDASVFTEIGELELSNNFDEDETFDSIDENETPRATNNVESLLLNMSQLCNVTVPEACESCSSDTTQASTGTLESKEDVLSDAKNNPTK